MTADKRDLKQMSAEPTGLLQFTASKQTYMTLLSP